MKAKTTGKSKGKLSRANARPASRISEDSGFRERRPFLDLKLPNGKYKVDEIALDISRRRIWKCDDPVQVARVMIDWAAAHAIEVARTEHSWPQAISAAKHLTAKLSKARGALAAVPNDVIPEVARAIAIIIDDGDDEIAMAEKTVDAAQGSIDQLLAKARELIGLIDIFVSRYGDSASVRAPNYDPLCGWFIEFVSIQWFTETGRWPTRKTNRYFVRLLAAGWQDAQLSQNEGPRGSWETWFSERLAKRKLIDKDC